MIYFDNAATTLKKPPLVVETVTQALTQIGNAGRGAHGDALKTSEIIYQGRQLLCELFNGEDPRQIIFTSGATESLNTVIQGCHQKGDHVITTMLEHNSVLRPLYRMVEENGLELTIIPADKKGNLDYQVIEQSVKENTRSLIVTDCSNVTGNRSDLEKISDICKKNHLHLIVDAAQSAGVLPIDIQKNNIDILCFTGHKSLYGMQGTGGFYVNPELVIRPLKVGGSGIDTYNHQQPSVMPTALEAGTINGHGVASLQAGVSYILSETLEEIYKRTMLFTRRFYQGVVSLEKVHVYGDFSVDNRGAIVSLNIGDLDSAEVSDMLANEYGIATRAGGHCAPLMHKALGTVSQGVVRFSFSSLNTIEEVDQGIEAVREIHEKCLRSGEDGE